MNDNGELTTYAVLSIRGVRSLACVIEYPKCIPVDQTHEQGEDDHLATLADARRCFYSMAAEWSLCWKVTPEPLEFKRL